MTIAIISDEVARVVQLPDTRHSDKLFLFLAILTALFALVMHVGIWQTNLTPAAWRSAASHIKAHYKKGDAIALMPAWALQGAQPLTGYPVLLSEHIEKEELDRYKRLWVLVAPRLGKWWFQHAFANKIKLLKQRYWLRQKVVFGWSHPKGSLKPVFVKQKTPQSFSRLEVYLFQLPPSQPLLYDFQSKKRLRQAEVSLETPPSRIRDGRCKVSTGKVQWLRVWREQPGWWMALRRGRYFFGRTIQEFGDTPRDCLYAEPQACKQLKVRYRNVPLQGELKLEHGFTTPAPGKVSATVPPSGPDIQIAVWAENRLLKRFQVSQKKGWRTHWLHLKQFKLPHHVGSVEFHIQTPSRQSGRVGYCFRATIRE